MKRETLMVKLKEKFGINTRTTEEWNDTKGGIWCTNHGRIDFRPALDYNAWEFDPNENTYVMGVHKELMAFLTSAGWSAEPYDPETWFIYQY